MGQERAKQIVEELKLKNKTRADLIAMVKDNHVHTVERNIPGYFSKAVLIEILSAQLQH